MSILFAENAPAADPKAILVFGDSLSEGFLLKHSEVYPALLAKKLRAGGPELFSDQRERHRRYN